jgi:uncharacterized protein HemX
MSHPDTPNFAEQPPQRIRGSASIPPRPPDTPPPPPLPPTTLDWSPQQPSYAAAPPPAMPPVPPPLTSTSVGPPMQFPPQQAAPRGSRAGLVILSVLAFLLLVGGALATLQWRSTASELDQTRADLRQTQDTVTTQDSEIDRLNDELSTTQQELDDARTELEGTENQVTLLEEEKDTIRECIVLVGEITDLEEAGEEPPRALLAEADTKCAEADRALGFQ